MYAPFDGKCGMIVYERNSIPIHDHSTIWRVLFCSWHLVSISGGRVWYVLNVVQCGAKLIAVYMIYAPPDRSDCGYKVEGEADVNAVRQWTRDTLLVFGYRRESLGARLLKNAMITARARVYTIEYIYLD
jgi:hypothetical protein